MGSDIEWEKWGKTDPYFGVITHPQYRKENITEDGLDVFFQSGFEYVDYVMQRCKKINSNFSPARILDFGCGVGRLTIPFSIVTDEVVGLDISDSMLAEAEENCKRHSVENVVLLKADDNLSSLKGGI